MQWIPRSLTLAAVMGAGLALGGCALQVRSDVNRTAFHAGQCHTFAFIGSFRADNPMHGTIANPVNESRLRAAITAHMATVGVQLVKDNADCLVGYGIGSTLVVDPGFPGPYGYGGYGYGFGAWGWGGPWGPWGWDGPYVYHQGVIGIDLYDGKTREALWHASVDQNLSGATGTDAEQRIDAAVAALFTHFPG
ncbi:MAG TPA: DUF4136 domain-containing protein [Steroidobacteraceae bacterium]|nr:DUF4136 domain-containing protein [Gammaproteobacteria bacterium]HEV2286008.1 DUF4136 domain-containing protein [Steroidobacteraceae bacterium]